MSRAVETLARIPLATLTIMALCFIVYGYQLLVDPPLEHYTMCPRRIIYLHQWYRVITSTMFHTSLMHIAMNMMSTMAIGSSLERQIGTIMMALTIFFGILLTGAIYISISWLLFAVFGLEKMMLQHAAGFSGVIFQLSVLESNLSPNRTRSVFGVFTVSSRMYPWALLVAIQLVMPHISFLGHLSGILIGSLQYHGALNVLFPREEYLQECETSERLSVLRAQPSYVPTPESTGLRGENGGGLQSAVLVGCGAVVQSVKNLCEAVRVIVFGRGAEMNSNIQLGVPWDVDAAAGLNDSLPLIEEDEEWAGLPEIIQRSTEER